jgi:predicted metal-binding protein
MEKKVSGICGLCGKPLPPGAKANFGTHNECQDAYEAELVHKNQAESEGTDEDKEIDFNKLIKIRVEQIDRSTIIMSKNVRSWCKLPYIRHPRGCPNYGKNPLCPPTIPYRKDILNKYNDFHLFCARFDIESYMARKKEIHPDRTDAQLRNLIYWQQSVKKRLKDAILASRIHYSEFFTAGGGMMQRPSMECVGIFVFATLQRNHIEFDRKAEKYVTLVALTCGHKQLDLVDYMKRISNPASEDPIKIM